MFQTISTQLYSSAGTFEQDAKEDKHEVQPSNYHHFAQQDSRAEALRLLATASSTSVEEKFEMDALLFDSEVAPTSVGINSNSSPVNGCDINDFPLIYEDEDKHGDEHLYQAKFKFNSLLVEHSPLLGPVYINPYMDAATLARVNVPIELQNILLGIPIIPSDAIVQDAFLGKGAFGQVYRGQWGSRKVAIKEMDLTLIQQNLNLSPELAREAFQWEISQLNRLNHPLIVELYGVMIVNNQPKVIMEFCEGGTLQNWLNSGNSLAAWLRLEETPAMRYASAPLDQIIRGQTLRELLRISSEIAQGLSYLHRKGVLHRDLKAENILLDNYGRAKLADLGVAQADMLLSANEASVVALGLTDGRFKAPEFIIQNLSSPATDIYAYGLVLWQLITGKEPQSLPQAVMLQRMQNGEREIIPADCHIAFRQLILDCWQIDPSERPTGHVIVNRLQDLLNVTLQDAPLILACEHLDVYLQNHRKELIFYQPPLLIRNRVAESIDIFWQRYEKGIKNSDLVHSLIHKIPEVNELKIPEELQDISKILEDFIINPHKRVLVFLGEGGLGKSLTTYQLADRLLSAWRQFLIQMNTDATEETKFSSLYFPVFVRPYLRKWAHSELANALEHVFNMQGFSLEAQAFLKKQVRLLLIVDGYDELIEDVPPQNLPNLLGMSQWPHAKLLVTSRPSSVSYIELSPRFCFQKQSEIYYFLPFNLTQLFDYLTKRLNWTSAEQAPYYQTVMENATLRLALRTPFVLKLFAESFQTISKKDLSTMNRFSIYQAFIESWMKTYQNLIPESVQLKLLGNHADLLASFMEFAGLIAWTSFSEKNLMVSIALAKEAFSLPSHQAWINLEKLLVATCHKNFDEREQALAANQNNKHRAILTRQDYLQLMQERLEQFKSQAAFQLRAHGYEFIHKSVWEFFIAHYIVQNFSEDLPQLQKVLQTLPLQVEPQILYFCIESQQISPHKEHLFGVIEASKGKPALGPSAANAATILNWADINLTKRHWEGVQLPGADLSYSVLVNTKLTNANLEGATLSHCNLRVCEVKGANLRAVIWGERPGIRITEELKAFSHHPYQPWLAIAQGKEMILVHRDTGEKFGKSMAHKNSIKDCTFSPNGKLLASLNAETIILWNVVNQKYVSKIGKGSRSCTFSPNGEMLATVGFDNTLRFWKVPNSIAIGNKPLRLPENYPSKFHFSPDGKFIVFIGHKDNTLHLWDISAEIPLVFLLKGHSKEVTSCVFSPDGKLLLSGSEDKTLRFWDVSTRKPIGLPLKGHTESVESCAFSPDGKLAISGSRFVIRFWEVSSHMSLGLPLYSNSIIGRCAFSPDGDVVISESSSNFLHLWEVAPYKTLGKPMQGHTEAINRCIFSPDGKLVATVSNDKSLRLWEVSTQKSFGQPLIGHTDIISCCAFSPDGKWIVSGSGDKTLRLWEIANQKNIGQPFIGHNESVTCCAFSPDGKLIVSGSSDHTLRIWDASAQKNYGQQLVGHGSWVTTCAFSPDGRLIFSGSQDNLLFWEVNTQKTFGKPLARGWGVDCCAFSPEGQMVVVGNREKSVRFIDVFTQTDLTPPQRGEHMAWITNCIFSKEGGIVVTASREGALCFWNAATKTCLNTINLGNGINALALNHNPEKGLEVAIGNYGGGVTFACISADSTITLLGSPAHHSMELRVNNGTSFSRSQMSLPTHRLLEQYGAQIEDVIICEDKEALVLQRPLMSLAVEAAAAPSESGNISFENRVSLKPPQRLGQSFSSRAPTFFSSAPPPPESRGILMQDEHEELIASNSSNSFCCRWFCC